MEDLAMKKEYMAPTVEEIKIANTYLLTGSAEHKKEDVSK